jgi:hypothetical protein
VHAAFLETRIGHFERMITRALAAEGSLTAREPTRGPLDRAALVAERAAAAPDSLAAEAEIAG